MRRYSFFKPAQSCSNCRRRMARSLRRRGEHISKPTATQRFDFDFVVVGQPLPTFLRQVPVKLRQGAVLLVAAQPTITITVTSP
jgi:hypothetical protein